MTLAPVAAVAGAVSAVVVVVAVGGGVVIETATGELVEVTNAAALVGVNIAVIEWEPAVENDVVVLAVPPDTLTGVPIAVDPSMNWTAPAAAAGDTVAVSDTLAPMVADIGLATSEVVVATAGAVTVTVVVELVDAVKAVASVGVNTAVIE